jgi:hypothetical protein
MRTFCVRDSDAGAVRNWFSYNSRGESVGTCRATLSLCAVSACRTLRTLRTLRTFGTLCSVLSGGTLRASLALWTGVTLWSLCAVLTGWTLRTLGTPRTFCSVLAVGSGFTLRPLLALRSLFAAGRLARVLAVDVPVAVLADGRRCGCSAVLSVEDIERMGSGLVGDSYAGSVRNCFSYNSR